jgi:hypothetical protein
MAVGERPKPLRMTEGEYEAMLEAQEGRCLLCGKLPGKTRLVRDHDHTTGRIRGLLHSRCNRALAPFEWSDDVLIALRRYITVILADRVLYNAGLSPHSTPSEDE